MESEISVRDYIVLGAFALVAIAVIYVVFKN